MSVEHTLVAAVAVFFVGMGAVALVRPAFVVGLCGTERLTRDGRSEVRAVYGGFGVAVGALLFLTFEEPAVRDGALLAVALSLGGMAAGRVVSALVDGLPGRHPWLFFVVELALTAALLAAR